MSRIRISDRELDVMKALWSLRREATVAEIHESLAGSGGTPAFTTVQTMLNRLAAKGQVRRRLEGRAYLYAPATNEPAAARAAIRNVLDRFFGGSAAQLAAHLVEEEMDNAEIRRVEALLQRKRKGRQ